jgi:hypothetical protein
MGGCLKITSVVALMLYSLCRGSVDMVSHTQKTTRYIHTTFIIFSIYSSPDKIRLDSDQTRNPYPLISPFSILSYLTFILSYLAYLIWPYLIFTKTFIYLASRNSIEHYRTEHSWKPMEFRTEPMVECHGRLQKVPGKVTECHKGVTPSHSI